VDLIVGDHHLAEGMPAGAGRIGMGGNTDPMLEENHCAILPSEIMVEGYKLRGSKLPNAVDSLLGGTADEPIPISGGSTEIVEVEVPGHRFTIAFV